MPFEDVIIDSEADLRQYPGNIEGPNPAIENVEFTLGDLHGNTLKLLYFLVRHKYVTMRQEDYAAFVTLYDGHQQKGSVSQEQIGTLNRLIGNMEFTAKKAIARLIGDIVADRGKNDLLTLEMLKKCREEGLDLRILFSNHDLEFLLARERGELLPKTVSFSTAQSMVNLNSTVEDEANNVTMKFVDQLMADGYLQQLKLIDFTLNQASDKFSYFTHAPVDLPIVQALVKKFGIDIEIDCIDAFIAAINQVNQRFSEVVMQGKLHEYIDMDVIKLLASSNFGHDDALTRSYSELMSDTDFITRAIESNDISNTDGRINADIATSFPLEMLIWNRRFQELELGTNGTIQLPLKKGSDKMVTVRNRYGHTEPGNEFGLDTSIGKPQPDGSDSTGATGEYRAACTEGSIAHKYRNVGLAEKNTARKLARSLAGVFKKKEREAAPSATESSDRAGPSMTSSASTNPFNEMFVALVSNEFCGGGNDMKDKLPDFLYLCEQVFLLGKGDGAEAQDEHLVRGYLNTILPDYDGSYYAARKFLTESDMTVADAKSCLSSFTETHKKDNQRDVGTRAPLIVPKKNKIIGEFHAAMERIKNNGEADIRQIEPKKLSGLRW